MKLLKLFKSTRLMNVSIMPIYVQTIYARFLQQSALHLRHYANKIIANRALTSQQKKILERNRVFKNKHKGEPAYVIVNGPSLASQDISKLKNKITFAVSGFWKHEVIKHWQPSYYSLSDPAFFNNRPETIKFYENLNEKITESIFFVPLYRGYESINQYGYLPKERTFYLATIGEVRTSNELTEIIQGFGSVSAFALSQAIYMGCSPIYLLGFDHDYLANRGVDRHFYTGGTIAGSSKANVPLADRISYDDEMKANLGLWANYRALKNIADSSGIEIFNCTEGGYLDVFPRMRYDETLK